MADHRPLPGGVESGAADQYGVGHPAGHVLRTAVVSRARADDRARLHWHGAATRRCGPAGLPAALAGWPARCPGLALHATRDERRTDTHQPARDSGLDDGWCAERRSRTTASASIPS